MNQLAVTINETQLSVKEHKGQRVVTLKEIDAVHQRADGTARKRFNDNKARFLEGVDYHKISASEFRTQFNSSYSKQAVEDVTLVTESGYLMLVKSFTDDLAWTVQRELVNSYFRAKKDKQSGMTEYQQMMAQTREANVRFRKAQMLERLGNQYEGTYKQVLHAHATKELTGEYLLPLPESAEKTYTATEIGAMLDINSNKVGKLANANGLKTDQYGKWFVDKSPHSSKEVRAFRYFESVVPELRKLLKE